MKRLTPYQYVGIVGAAVFAIAYIRRPSFPTPDKIIVFATLLFMALGQAKELLKRFLPFGVLLYVYESFRGIVPHINHNVNYMWMPGVDRWFTLGGELPTKVLQTWLWQGNVQWYDLALYIFYMLHFVLPFVLAVVVWKLRERQYWRLVTTYIVVSFAGFLTFLAFPAAPPWMASDMGLIEPIRRISSDVWFALGVQDFSTLYNKVSPNPVAAVPSLHAAYATIFAIFVIRLFKTKWRYLSLIYPFAIYFGTVYQGEHYLIDEILGAAYAFGAYAAAPYILTWLQRGYKKTKKKLGLQTTRSKS